MSTRECQAGESLPGPTQSEITDFGVSEQRALSDDGSSDKQRSRLQ